MKAYDKNIKGISSKMMQVAKMWEDVSVGHNAAASQLGQALQDAGFAALTSTMGEVGLRCEYFELHITALVEEMVADMIRADHRRLMKISPASHRA